MSKPIVPRYYQIETLNAFISFFETLLPGIKANGCAVLPTGTGKSLVIAMLIKYFYERWGVRLIILCHAAELIKQDFEKACEYWPEGKHLFGINSEQLGRRDCDHQIIFATIQSVCNTPELFFEKNEQPFNVAFVDEVQRVPESGDGQYLTTFDYFKSVNKDFRAGGLTAADWRLGTGRICKPGNIMTHKIYEFTVMDAIQNGFMATPINRATKHKIDRSKFKIQGGEFTDASVNKVMTEDDLIRNQIEEAIRTAEEFEREYWIINCFSIIHANAVYKEVQRRGIVSDVVHSDIKGKEKRKDIIAKYRERMTTAIIHVDMLSLGVDFPHSDYCLMQSPTNSSERYYQKVGRVLRVTPIPCPKCGTMSVVVEDNCQECGCLLERTYKQKTGFILDQDGNVAAHGAINCDISSPDKGVRQKRRNKLKECKNENCLEEVAIHLKVCPFCETPFPTRERENKTLLRAAHDKILVEPEWLDVDSHQFFVSIKKGVIQHHLFLKDNVKVTNKLELGSSDPLKNKKAKKHLSKLLNGDIPKTIESFVEDGYREKIPCPVQVLVTQQTGFRRLEDYKFN